MKCPACAAATKRATISLTVSVDGRKFVGDLRGHRCPKCKLESVDGPAGARFELQVAAELVQRGLRSGASFKFIRKALGMKAADLARIMNVAVETISRWETSQREVDWPEYLVLGSLVDDKLAGRTTILTRAAALASPHLSRLVRLRFHPA